jgi:UPF0755 protein
MPRIVKFIAGFAAAIAAVCLFAGAAAAAAFAFGNSAPEFRPGALAAVDGAELGGAGGESGALVRFEVRRGESARSVGNRLADAGLIRSRAFWNLMGRFADEHIKVGVYFIEVPSTQMAIRALLETGRDELVRVTVPEGLTLRETALVLEAAGITPARDFIAAASDPEILGPLGIPGDTMEGFLFPDTYLFPSGFPAARVVQAMAANFFAQLAAIDERLPALPLEDLARLVVLASIVEKEYRVAEEAAVMAGVFANRLRVGMMLESCATVVYVITEKLGRPHPNRIFYVDLELPSPFNTYRNLGLPPAPIASPGLIALRAAFEPEQTDYLFFRLVNEATGHHVFSRTYAEHVRAGALFVRGW